jgi:hypothetical protein
MADRTSAKIFGRFFQELADLPEEGQGPQRAKRISRDLVKLIRDQDYDFAFYQMGVDDALVTLGLEGLLL